MEVDRMKISVNANGCITLYEIYNEIELVSKDEVLVICERDGHFDILHISTVGEEDNEV